MWTKPISPYRYPVCEEVKQRPCGPGGAWAFNVPRVFIATLMVLQWHSLEVPILPESHGTAQTRRLAQHLVMLMPEELQIPAQDQSHPLEAGTRRPRTCAGKISLACRPSCDQYTVGIEPQLSIIEHSLVDKVSFHDLFRWGVDLLFVRVRSKGRDIEGSRGVVASIKR